MESCNPLELFKYNRFDVAAKIIYARIKDLNLQTHWGEEIYKEHLRVWNNFNEILNPNKNNINKFIEDYNNLLSNIKEFDFDYRHPVLINDDNLLINGSHRLSACILHNKNICFKYAIDAGREGQWYCSYQYFKDRDLDEKYLDAMACEYCNTKKNTYIAVLFPSATSFINLNDIESIFNKLNINIVYLKKINLTKNGLFNTIRQMYWGEDWGGNWNNNFYGINEKTNLCWENCGVMIAYLIESDNIESIKKSKELIREIFKIGNHSIHINDSHRQTIDISNLLFNSNGIDFINKYNIEYLERFESYLDIFKESIINLGINTEDVCVTSSGTLARFGIRDVNDIDILYSKNIDMSLFNNKTINSHISESQYYDKTIDDLLYNPTNYFWYGGVKFVSIDRIKQMKLNRKENKDINDINMIENHFLKLKNG
jgi:hypothetical protein